MPRDQLHPAKPISYSKPRVLFYYLVEVPIERDLSYGTMGTIKYCLPLDHAWLGDDLIVPTEVFSPKLQLKYVKFSSLPS